MSDILLNAEEKMMGVIDNLNQTFVKSVLDVPVDKC